MYFVTGASSGIGRACARMFAENGFVVTGVSRNTDETTEVFPGGGSLTLRKLDATDTGRAIYAAYIRSLL